MEGVGQRATERLLGVSHNSITNWVEKAVCGKVLKATPAEKVEWVEADELWTYIAKKKDDGWHWWAIDRASKRVLGWALGNRGTDTAERLDAQLPHAAHIGFATDCWQSYGKIFSEESRVQGKAHTFTIESLNNASAVIWHVSNEKPIITASPKQTLPPAFCSSSSKNAAEHSWRNQKQYLFSNPKECSAEGVPCCGRIYLHCI